MARRGDVDSQSTSTASHCRAPRGGFYVTQDADLNAHEVGKRFITGHEYYALGEKERLALGVPRAWMLTSTLR